MSYCSVYLFLLTDSHQAGDTIVIRFRLTSPAVSESSSGQAPEGALRVFPAYRVITHIPKSCNRIILPQSPDGLPADDMDRFSGLCVSQAVPTVDERLKLQCAPLAGDQYRTLKVLLPGKRSDQLPHLKEQVIAPDSQQEKQAQTLYIRAENRHCASQQKSTDIQEYPRIHKVPSPRSRQVPLST